MFYLQIDTMGEIMNRYMKKQSLLLITLILLTLFFFGCQNNFLQKPKTDKPLINIPAGYGRASLTISDHVDNVSPRTVFPPQPSFSSYKFSFFPRSGQQQLEFDIINELPLLSDIDLEEGEWEITAYGRVEFYGNEEEIAEGSVIVTVIANQNIEALITIRSKPLESIGGVFNWKLFLTDDVEAEFWELALFDWPGDTDVILFDEGVVDDREIEGSMLCENGYYVLRISLGSERKEVSYFSIVHIRGYETTYYERLVKPAEFLPVINISGSVNLTSIKLDGGPIKINERPDVYIKEVRAFLPSGNIVGVSDVDSNTQWLIRIVEPNEEIELEFRLVLNIGLVELELKHTEKKFVFKDDMSVNIEIDRNLIKLKGYLTFKPDNYKNFPNWKIKAFTDDNSFVALHNVDIISDGTWEMIIEPFDVLTYVHLSVENTIEDIKYKRTFLNVKEVLNERIETTINLNADFNPPTQVWLYGNNFSDVQYEPMINYNGRFAFIRKKDISTQNCYSFKIIANFGETVSDPDKLTNPKYYNFEDIITSNSVLTLNNKAGAIEWKNNDLSRTNPVDNVKIALDFINDEFFDEKMMPAICVEKTNTVYIPGGTFIMGSPTDEKGRNGTSGKSSETQHTVILNSFVMMSTEVNQDLYEDIMGINPVKNSDRVFTYYNYPIVNVSWYDAVEFANRLSERDGLTPVYGNSAVQEKNITIDDVDWNASGWRLPTEAEWEYAARAGSNATFTAFYDSNGNLLNENGKTISYDLANYNFVVTNGNEYSQKPEDVEHIECITDVNKYYPNVWGLYNMHGNVWEMCWDIFEGDYGSQTQENPKGHRQDAFYNVSGANTDDEKEQARSQSHRTIRGGSYYTSSRYLRSAHRGIIGPNNNFYNDIGFRLVRKGILP